MESHNASADLQEPATAKIMLAAGSCHAQSHRLLLEDTCITSGNLRWVDEEAALYLYGVYEVPLYADMSGSGLTLFSPLYLVSNDKLPLACGRSQSSLWHWLVLQLCRTGPPGLPENDCCPPAGSMESDPAAVRGPSPTEVKRLQPIEICEITNYLKNVTAAKHWTGSPSEICTLQSL